MDFEDARKIERPGVEVGQRYTFYSTMQQEYDAPEKRMRNHTGRLVTVKSWDNGDAWTAERVLASQWERENPEGEWEYENDERWFTVVADDGFEFSAMESELNGFMCDTGQFFWPDATWGPEHCRRSLANEKAAA